MKALRTIQENVNGWDVVTQIHWTCDEGYTASAYGCKPLGYGTNWRIEATGKFVKMNRNTGTIHGKPYGGAWDTPEEVIANCTQWKAGTMSPGD